MSSLLSLSNLSAATPDGRPLFGDLTFSIGAERIGLVGRNGSGKSTLLKIAAGRIEPVSGRIARAGTIGMLEQSWPEEQSVAEALGVADALTVIERVVAGCGDDADFETADWTLVPRIEAALSDLDLAGLPLDRRMGSLSGGEQMRIGIARVTLEKPDLLLLDEPTNDLDREGREAIYRMVTEWRGGVLVASHDRGLLEPMDRIVELTTVGVRIVGGGWSDFVAARDADRMRAEADRAEAEATLRSTRQAAQLAREARDQRDKAGRAFAARGSEPRSLLGRQAERAENSGSRARRLGERQVDEAKQRLEAARAIIEVRTPMAVDLQPSGLPVRAEILEMQEVTVDFGGRRLGPWSLDIRGPERIALSGRNGAGKSTLLRVAAGAIMPTSGIVRSRRERIAMLDQDVALLDDRETILANMRRLHPSLDAEAAHAVCARFAFRNRDAERLVGTLSGGEKLRAGLAVALSGKLPPWLLILDEPTNHLDIEAIELLERSLKEFDGALLIVSHDDAFLNAIGITRTVQIGE
jgi:ATPase subunit of ABC transporter with duplicated ATPase domains